MEQTPFLRWLVDFYVGSTVLLGLAALAIQALKQPARRRLVSCATAVGLCFLLITSVLPLWPRIALAGTGAGGQESGVGSQGSGVGGRGPALSGVEGSADRIGNRLDGGQLAAPELASESRPGGGSQGSGVSDQESGVGSRGPALPALSGVEGSGVEGSADTIGNRPDSLFTQRILPASFLLGAGLIGGWLLLGAWLAHRLIKQGKQASKEVMATVSEITGSDATRLLISSALTQPVAAGVFRPTILIPPMLTNQESDPELRAAIAHEWHHIRRGDLFFLAITRLLSIVLFAHPLFWWLKRRLYLDQEYLADHVAAGSSTPIAYAEYLLRWSQARAHQPLFAWAAAASTAGLRLRRRLAMLLRPPQTLECRVHPRWRLFISCAASLCVMLVSLATLWPQRQVLAQERSPAAVLVVERDGTAPYRSVQAAIEAAPPNALIRIGPGVYDERLTITKPVMLEGAGWEKTRISLSNEGQPWEFDAIEEEMMKQLASAASEEERNKLRTKATQFLDSLGHTISKVDSVSLRNLTFTMPGISREGGRGFGAIIKVNGSRASLANCAIVGGPGNGLQLDETSEVEMNECLVAAVWGTGLIVKGKAHVRRSDIRNCYYTGISIHHTAGPTVVEECKISGAAWHGIRYDDTSPTVRRNHIFANARTGIYGSGKTAATVEENLFEQNAMGGVTCWFQNADVIERNTFVRNGGTGVSSLGASVPVVRRNLFVEDAIKTGDIGSTSPFAKVGAGPTKEGNVLWETVAEAQANGAQHFVDAAQGNFAFKADSSLRAEKVGAAESLLRRSLWPLQPEETAIIPEGNTRDSTQWKRNKTTVAAAQVATPSTDSGTAPAPASSAASAPAAQSPPNPLQALIDAAAPGSTVVIPKGVYTQPVVLGKPLTLRGADKEGCRLEVTSDQPALSFRGPGSVSIENLTIRWQLETSQRSDQPRCALYLKDAKAVVSNCDVEALGNKTRCPAGIVADGFSDAQLAQLETKGFDFTIQYGGGALGTVRDCVIRDPGHCGITVGNDSDVIIERNIVTGSEFHGVRCTGGKLTVRDNLIVQNKNRGIYLGNRRAVGEIANNVILGNESGISGFADAAVKIHNNLIAQSGFVGLDMRDTCALEIAENIFHQNKAGIILFVEKGKQSATLGKNVFWKNETNVTDLQVTGEMLEADPAFANAAGGDFGVGAKDLTQANQGLSQPAVLADLWKRWEKMQGR